MLVPLYVLLPLAAIALFLSLVLIVLGYRDLARARRREAEGRKHWAEQQGEQRN